MPRFPPIPVNVNLKDMTDKQKTKMRKDVLAATTSPAPPPTTSSGTAGPAVFFMSSVI
jgi:hypothetical protein